MHKFSYWQEGLTLTLVFFVIMTVSCAFIAYFGSKLIHNLGQRPTNSEKIQMDMLIPLGVTMLFSFGPLGLFLWVLS